MCCFLPDQFFLVWLFVTFYSRPLLDLYEERFAIRLLGEILLCLGSFSVRKWDLFAFRNWVLQIRKRPNRSSSNPNFVHSHFCAAIEITRGRQKRPFFIPR